MGGPGSGRWYRWDTKGTIEGCRRIDVRDWHRRGLLRGRGFTWSWYTDDGERVAWIQARVEPGRQVTLMYRVSKSGEVWQDVTELIALAWTPCHYGGQRPWFICPGWGCGRRVAKLHLGGGYFLCRHCLDLVYERQREDQATRLISKAQKIRRRLGGSASLMEPFPSKPRYMHRRTYDRLWWKTHEVEEAGLQAILGQLERMSARISFGVSPQRDR